MRRRSSGIVSGWNDVLRFVLLLFGDLASTLHKRRMKRHVCLATDACYPPRCVICWETV